jgi:uncharacterized protein (TIGR00299 family) protein
MSQAGSTSDLRGATLYFDCATGLAGDMTLAALLDLGVPESFVRQQLALLPLSSWELRISQVTKHGMVGKKVDVVDLGTNRACRTCIVTTTNITTTIHPHTHEHHDDGHQHHDDHPHHHDEHPHTHYVDIRRMLMAAPLLSDVKTRALVLFDRLAEVEAAMHGVPVGEVMFHEVGALDSIVDIVGVAAALSWLGPRRVVSRTVPLGSGRVRTAHGLLPIPAPATIALLKGAQVEPSDLLGELTTPTGALIVSVYAESYGPLPAMRVVGTGHGAGTRELPDRPNILRIIAGHESGAAVTPSEIEPTLWELATNLDDMNPQLLPPLVESLLVLGARDAWLTPVLMKKGRPGTLLQVLCDDDKRARIIDHILAETTSLGLRCHRVSRFLLDREIITVETIHGSVAVKLGRDPKTRQVRNVAPEFESVRAVAAACAVPLKQVYAAAVAAADKLIHATS